MSPSHLNSDQRQYFWLSILLAMVLAYVGAKSHGLLRPYLFLIAAIECGCAFLIYRRWKHVAWVYLVGTLGIVGWSIMQVMASGKTWMSIFSIVAPLLMLTGFYWLGEAMKEESRDSEETSGGEGDSDYFELPEEHRKHVDELIEAYSVAFGEPQWVHHLVPKQLWLHRYADYIITIPPTDSRPTWLYGTLLISAHSDWPVELILERPEEDTVGAIGTLSYMMEHFLDRAPLREWNTIGVHPFFGDNSPVRGLLFCPPPRFLQDSLQLSLGGIELRYTVGITEEQLEDAQREDDEKGDLAGAKALYQKLEIAELGIKNLAR